MAALQQPAAGAQSLRSLLKQIEKSAFTPIKRAIRRLRRNRVPIKLNGYESYNAYRQAQNDGNMRKLHLVAAHEANIGHLARYAAARLGRADLKVLCHGSRNGTEQRWFRAHLGRGSCVLGTEIADTATQFPDTIQWDFHNMKPEWAGAWDVIYSNSWDHAFDPERAFSTWMTCLAPNGMLLLEHSHYHTPAHVTELDPFGASISSMGRKPTAQSQAVDLLAGVGVHSAHVLPPRAVRSFMEAASEKPDDAFHSKLAGQGTTAAPATAIRR